MAMTPDEMSKLTLGELEWIAQRFSAAIATIKEAQALLGAPMHGHHAPVGVLAQLSPVELPPRPVNAPAAQPTRISPEAQAELDAWRNSAARAKLMDQFKQTPEGDAHDD